MPNRPRLPVRFRDICCGQALAMSSGTGQVRISLCWDGNGGRRGRSRGYRCVGLVDIRDTGTGSLDDGNVLLCNRRSSWPLLSVSHPSLTNTHGLTGPSVSLLKGSTSSQIRSWRVRLNKLASELCLS